MAQGYLIGRPMPMNELKDFIRTYKLPKIEKRDTDKAAPISFKIN